VEFNAAKPRASVLQNFRMVAVSPSCLETTEWYITSGALDIISVFLHRWIMNSVCSLAFY